MQLKPLNEILSATKEGLKIMFPPKVTAATPVTPVAPPSAAPATPAPATTVGA